MSLEKTGYGGDGKPMMAFEARNYVLMSLRGEKRKSECYTAR